MSQLSGRPGSPGSETPDATRGVIPGTTPDTTPDATPGTGPADGALRADVKAGESPAARVFDDEAGDEADDEGGDEPRGFGASVVAALKEFVIVVVLAMVLSFVVKTWFFQAFYIPSGSMEDTLVTDDRVIVSKLTPGPFDLQRGDVVVFEDPMEPQAWLGNQAAEGSDLGGPLHDTLVFVGLLPEDSARHLIKRVIGLPGDHIQSAGAGKLKVNGVEITEPYIKPGDAPSNDAFDIVVPEGRVWVMGDHRSNSEDSRPHDDGTGKTGSVPMQKIVGRALFVVWPFDHVTWLGTPERTFVKVPAPTPGATPKPRSTGVDPAPTTPAPTVSDKAASS